MVRRNKTLAHLDVASLFAKRGLSERTRLLPDRPATRRRRALSGRPVPVGGADWHDIRKTAGHAALSSADPRRTREDPFQARVIFALLLFLAAPVMAEETAAAPVATDAKPAPPRARR